MSSAYHLTRKQREIYHFLLNNQELFEHPPTLDEICASLNLKSRGSLHKHIQGLIAAGLIEPPNRRQRGVRLTSRAYTEEKNANNLPLVGVIAAGKPIEAIENISFMSVPSQLKTNKPCYILQVKGDSMLDHGIFDGDWVVIEQRNQARNGEVVVALIDKTEATLKIIEQHPDETILIPANKNMEAMHFHPQQVEIQGVLVGQMRSYQ